MFKNIDFYIKTRSTLCVRVFFFQSKNVILHPYSACYRKKMCKVHMRAFEIVAHRNVDNWTQ